MSKITRINSENYWDGRFSADWESCEGPRQSRFFSRLTLENLPSWLIEKIRVQSLTLVDWGCAQGDGTDVWASYISSQQLTGVDFSAIAIEQASNRYPSIRFLNENWLEKSTENNNSYDIVFSSNTLEHFSQPYEVLDILGARAKKAVILALPYREFDRIDEHFYSFSPTNIPLELKNGFRIIWSRVINCRHLPNTLWAGDQIFMVYAESSWLNSLKLTLSDCKIEQDDTATAITNLHQEIIVVEDQLASLGQEVATRDGQITNLNQSIIERNEQITNLNQSVIERDGQITHLNQSMIERNEQITNLNQSAIERDGQITGLNRTMIDKDLILENSRREISILNSKIDDFIKSRSWRYTRPFRFLKDLGRALVHPPERYALVKRIYWYLPAFLRQRLNAKRAAYVSKNLKMRKTTTDLYAPPRQASTEWIARVKASSKVVVIPCGFEFEELVNQRPINAAKYFSQNGYLVLFVAWQWAPEETLAKGCAEVWPQVWQIPLYDFLDLHVALPSRDQEALYLLTMPAAVLINCVPNLRSKGYAIIYDVMDDWEEFFNSGQAPWYVKELEAQLVLQSDLVCGVSPALVDKFSAIRTDIFVNGNGYTAEVLGLENRYIANQNLQSSLIIGYFGHLTDAWFDWELIFSLAENYNNISFEIIGYGEPKWAINRAKNFKNLRLIGKVLPSELNTYVRNWSYGIIPFIESDLSLAVDPIKIYEYIYFGLPVFVTGIEHLKNYPSVAWAKREAAIELFDVFLKKSKPDAHQVQEFLAKTTWEARFNELCARLHQQGCLGNLYVF